MPSDFNIPLSMPSWNEQVTARPQAGLLSQQAELRKRKMLQLQAELAAAAATPPSFSYEQLSDGIPPVENFAPPPLQNLIQQPQHIGGSTTGLIGGPPPIDARMTLTKQPPQRFGYERHMRGNNSVAHPSIPRQQPTLSGVQPISVPAPRLLQTPSNVGLMGVPPQEPPLSSFAYEQFSSPPPDVSNKANAQAVLEKYFEDDAIVQGLMANAFHESKFDPEVFETPKQSEEEKAQNMPGTFKKDQEQGYGLFQFTGEHLTDYVDWLDKTGLEDSMDAQVKFVHDSIYTNASKKIQSGPNEGKYVYTGPHDIGGEARKKLLKDFYSGDPGKIAESFAKNYEKMQPEDQPEVRRKTAKQYAAAADPVFPSNQLLDYQFGQGSNLGMPTTKKTKKKIATKPLKPS